MRNQKIRSQLVVIIGSVLVFVGLIMSLLFNRLDKTITLITTLTAVIGAFAVYIQIRKTKHVEQSSFTIEISKFFYEIDEISEIEHKIARSIDLDHADYVITKEDMPALLKYLNYVKTLASLIDSKVVTIETVNNVFSYEFFAVLHNPSVQKIEIIPFEYCYHDVFELHKKWIEYCRKNNINICREEYSLEKLEVYQNYFAGRKAK